MLKLSITLPNNAQINLESEDEVVIDRILGIVLADVTRALLVGISVPDPGVGGSGAIESVVPPAPSPNQPSVSGANITNAPESPPEETPLQVSEPVLTPVDEQPGALFNMRSVPGYDQQRELAQEGEPVPTERETATQDPPLPTWQRSDLLGNGVGTTNGSPAGVGNHAGMPSLVPAVSEQAFVDFCRAANPLGDMRRVVVAAEGAGRYLASQQRERVFGHGRDLFAGHAARALLLYPDLAWLVDADFRDIVLIEPGLDRPQELPEIDARFRSRHLSAPVPFRPPQNPNRGPPELKCVSLGRYGWWAESAASLAGPARRPG